jgi:hypothetical protein
VGSWHRSGLGWMGHGHIPTVGNLQTGSLGCVDLNVLRDGVVGLTWSDPVPRMIQGTGWVGIPPFRGRTVDAISRLCRESFGVDQSDLLGLPFQFQCQSFDLPVRQLGAHLGRPDWTFVVALLQSVLSGVQTSTAPIRAAAVPVPVALLSHRPFPVPPRIRTDPCRDACVPDNNRRLSLRTWVNDPHKTPGPNERLTARETASGTWVAGTTRGC